jgi:NMD protein affecting ribosome stability and mRNA decay
LNKTTLGNAIRIELKLNCQVRVREFSTKEAKTEVIFEMDERQKVVFPKIFEIKIAHETCQRCYQISSGYYEAVIQLRGNRMKIEKLHEKLKKYVEKRGGFIAKVDMVENGEDIYVNDKLMTNEFFTFHRLKPIRSFRLYGMRQGRKAYRNTYSMHL